MRICVYAYIHICISVTNIKLCSLVHFMNKLVMAKQCMRIKYLFKSGKVGF